MLGCAAELFAERGYHRCTVSDIVERAGIARGTFYLYFADKRSIFEELLDRFLAALRERIAPVDPAVGLQEGMRRIRANIRAVIALMLERRALTTILLSHASGLDPDFDRKLGDFYGEITRLLERSLSLGQRFGYVREGDVRLKAIFVLGAIKELMLHVLAEQPSPDPDRLADELVAHARDGLLQPSVERPERAVPSSGGSKRP